MRKSYTISWQNHRLELGNRTRIMGVLNVTPDSFSDGGLYFDVDKAVAHGMNLAAAGADILDIGGESTRPFSEAVSTAQEIERVIPVIEGLAHRVPVPISIDTSKAPVAKAAIAAGASAINDIGALRLDPDMGRLAAETGVPVVLMHMLGSPKTMQVAPIYADLIGDIRAFFQDAISRATAAGIAKSKIIIDPGIGFGKTVEHNLELIQRLGDFQPLDTPILVGPSRKAFIRKILKERHQDDIPADLPMVETGTQAAVAAAILNGAHMVRVHDVANTAATVKIIDAVAAPHSFS